MMSLITNTTFNEGVVIPRGKEITRTTCKHTGGAVQKCINVEKRLEGGRKHGAERESV